MEGSLLIFRCMNDLIPRGEQTALCHENGSWVPDPAQHACSTPAGKCSLVLRPSNVFTFHAYSVGRPGYEAR